MPDSNFKIKMFPRFDRSKINLLSLNQRKNNLDLSVIKPLKEASEVHPDIEKISEKIKDAKIKGASIILMMGAHVIRSGVQRFIIDLMKKGYISCIATNGASVIHDYEFSLIGGTTESVERYIHEGQFGLWKETGYINDIINNNPDADKGAGEIIGKAIHDGDYPNKDVSILRAGYKYRIPITIHIGIGYDIIHQHENFDPAIWAKASYNDFLIYTQCLSNIENGVVMNFGSAVMAPEIYLKALAMVRNTAKMENRTVSNFTTMVCDLKHLPDDYSHEADKDDPNYYFRPWKTMLLRTVSIDGCSYYVRKPHAESIPQLWTSVTM